MKSSILKRISSFIRGTLPQDPLEWQILVLSLILGVMIQVQVTSGNPNYREERFLTAVVQNLPPDYKVDPADLEVKVTLSGGRNRLANLLNEDLEVFMNFGDLPEIGGQAHPILIVRVPAGIEVVGGNRRISLPVERWITRTMDVEKFHRETKPEGVEVISGSPDPPSLVVSGPYEAMSELVNVEVEINLGTIFQSERLTLEPLGRDGNKRIIRGLLFEPSEVAVEVQATTVLEHRVLTVVPEFSGSLAEGHYIRTFSVDPPRVILVGAGKDVRDLISLSTVPIALVGRDETFFVEIPLFPPRDSKATPDVVTVAVEIAQIIEDVRLEGIPVYVRGGGGWHVEPSVITLILRGPVTQLSLLTPEQILADVRIEALPCQESTECEQRLEISLPDGLVVKETFPEMVVLTKLSGAV
ncbi:hypothetical protein H8D30_05630 [bacterium]|nr:hypothetical protein [bacterium]